MHPIVPILLVQSVVGGGGGAHPPTVVENSTSSTATSSLTSDGRTSNLIKKMQSMFAGISNNAAYPYLVVCFCKLAKT